MGSDKTYLRCIRPRFTLGMSPTRRRTGVVRAVIAKPTRAMDRSVMKTYYYFSKYSLSLLSVEFSGNTQRFFAPAILNSRLISLMIVSLKEATRSIRVSLQLPHCCTARAVRPSPRSFIALPYPRRPCQEQGSLQPRISRAVRTRHNSCHTRSIACP
jgi:hypothetical protein